MMIVAIKTFILLFEVHTMRGHAWSARRLGIFTKRSTTFALLLLLPALLLAACAGSKPSSTGPSKGSPESAPAETAGPGKGAPPAPEAEPAPSREREASEEMTAMPAAVIAAHNRLGLLLFQQLLAEPVGGDGNVVLSPVSVALALGMAWNGAAGETEAAMAEALQLQPLLQRGLKRDDVHGANATLLDELLAGAGGEAVRLTIANAVWHRREVALSQEFLQQSKRLYRAVAEGLDFEAPESVRRINGWVSDATGGLVPAVVDALDPDQVMLLINAVYFKGAWSTPFDPRQTRERPFHLPSGETKLAPMMQRDGRIDYYENGFQAVRLPYGGERWAMYFFLPPKGTDLGTLAQDLTLDTLNEAFAGFAPAEGLVILPRLNVSYKAKLNDALEALGMGIAFRGGQADFSRMAAESARGQRNLYLGDVVHQSVLKVDEEGTEAAAVTSVEVRVTSAPAYQFRFQADRPFLFVIRDDATGALLFLGAVLDPAGE